MILLSRTGSVPGTLFKNANKEALLKYSIILHTASCMIHATHIGLYTCLNDKMILPNTWHPFNECSCTLHVHTASCMIHATHIGLNSCLNVKRPVQESCQPMHIMPSCYSHSCCYTFFLCFMITLVTLISYLTAHAYYVFVLLFFERARSSLHTMLRFFSSPNDIDFVCCTFRSDIECLSAPQTQLQVCNHMLLL